MASFGRSGNGSKKRTLRVEYDNEQGFWRVAGPTAGFGTYQTKTEAKQKAEQVFRDKDLYNKLEIRTRDGALQQTLSETNEASSQTQDASSKKSHTQTFKKGLSDLSRTVGSAGRKVADKASEYEKEPEETDTDESGGGPALPGFGPQTDEDQERQGPTLPGGMGGGGGREGAPSLPGGMGGSGGDGRPMVPGFGMGPKDDDEDDEEERGFNFPGF